MEVYNSKDKLKPNQNQKFGKIAVLWLPPARKINHSSRNVNEIFDKKKYIALFV